MGKKDKITGTRTDGNSFKGTRQDNFLKRTQTFSKISFRELTAIRALV